MNMIKALKSAERKFRALPLPARRSSPLILAFPLGGRCHAVTEEGCRELEKPFRTRLYTWLPPEGEAGAERLMRGYHPCDRRSNK